MNFSSPTNSEVSPLFLGDFSTKDKSWDRLKSNNLKVAALYLQIGWEKYSARMLDCAKFLDYGVFIDSLTGKHEAKLREAHFCRIRLCPICQERKSMRWFARFHEAFPALLSEIPTARFLFLTLTVKNCHVTELRETVKLLNAGWQRLSQRKFFPAVGWMKSIEVTRRPDGMVHPHIHALLMVRSSYFKTHYVRQDEWTRHWKECMGFDYTPIVHIVSVKQSEDSFLKSVLEVAKYETKAGDIIFGSTGSDPKETISNGDFLRIISEQLSGTKAVALGGMFKKVMSEEDPEDLIGQTDSGEKDTYDLSFGWRERYSRYTQV